MGDASTRTTCPYCGVGCGIIASRTDDGAVAIAGDPEHPANFGRLCSKGAALGETLSLDDRLLHPLIDGNRVSWNTALQTVAHRLGETIAEHGPDSVAFYVSGQLLTEDYYVAYKLMKGFIWTDRLASNGRVDALVDAAVDPVSGQPALKQAEVRIEPFAARFHAVAVMRERPTRIAADYWVVAPIAGGIVCACLGVGRNDILAAVKCGAGSVAAVGVATQAGTNCGSSRAEIGRVLDAARLAQTG